MIIIDPTAGNNANTVIIRGTFAYNYTGRSLTDGTTTVALNANGEANLLRYLNLIARGNAIHLTGTAPPVFTAPVPTAPPVQGPTTTTLTLGDTWFDIPASPAIGDMVDASGLLVPFFYDNAVVTSLGTNSQFPALPLIINTTSTGLQPFTSFYDYNRISGGAVPTVTGAAEATANNFNSANNPGSAGNNQISGVVGGSNISFRLPNGTTVGPDLVQPNDGFINIGLIAYNATTYAGGMQLSDVTEASYWYRTNRFTGTLTWNGTIWNPTTGTLPTS